MASMWQVPTDDWTFYRMRPYKMHVLSLKEILWSKPSYLILIIYMSCFHTFFFRCGYIFYYNLAHKSCNSLLEHNTYVTVLWYFVVFYFDCFFMLSTLLALIKEGTIATNLGFCNFIFWIGSKLEYICKMIVLRSTMFLWFKSFSECPLFLCPPLPLYSALLNPQLALT